MTRTPLRRTGGMKRTRLRPVSAKRRRENRLVNDLEGFADQFIGYTCWLCAREPSTEIHHISGRAHPRRHARTNLFACCSTCHDRILPRLGVPGVFLLKEIRDPEGYDKQLAAELLKAKCGRVDAP